MKTKSKKSKNKINLDNKKTIEKNCENKAETINNNKDNSNNNNNSKKITETNSKKEKNSKSTNSSVFIDDINLNGKKDESNDKNRFLNQKRKSPSNISANENSLVMPLFADDEVIEKDGKDLKEINKDNNSFEGKEEMISTSLKEINIILNQGEKFISIIKGKKFIDTIKSKEKIRKTRKV